MAADAEVRIGLQRLARGVDQMPSPRSPHGEHPSSHFADANNRINCEQLQPTGAFVAIASKTRSDDERLIWRFLDLFGWTVSSISGARIFLLLPFVCCPRTVIVCHGPQECVPRGGVCRLIQKVLANICQPGGRR